MFGKINYNWQDKYIINLTSRKMAQAVLDQPINFLILEPSSWHSYSLRKILLRNLSFVSFGKLRGGYGTTANDQIGDYRFINLYGPNPNVAVHLSKLWIIYPLIFLILCTVGNYKEYNLVWILDFYMIEYY